MFMTIILRTIRLNKLFADIDADIYIMADGDGTYDSTAAPKLIQALLDERVDMVVGTRKDVTLDAGRKGHAFGNAIFNKVYQAVFGNDFTLPIIEVPTEYGVRQEGSESKLSTFGDGFKILRMIATLMKETRPFAFFTLISAALMSGSFIFAAPVLVEYFQTGLVERMPT